MSQNYAQDIINQVNSQNEKDLIDEVLITGMQSFIEHAFTFGKMDDGTIQVLKSFQLCLVDLEQHLFSRFELTRNLRKIFYPSTTTNEQTKK